jgi:hypothetical protein
LVTNNANNSVYLLFDYNLIGFEKIDKNTDILLIPYLLNLFTEAYSKGFVPLSFMHWPPTNQEIRPGQNVYVTIQVDDPECKLNDIEDLRFISGLALFTEDPKYININRPSIEIEEYIKAKIVLFDFFPERLTLGEILYRENGKVYGGNVGARRQIFE